METTPGVTETVKTFMNLCRNKEKFETPASSPHTALFNQPGQQRESNLTTRSDSERTKPLLGFRGSVFVIPTSHVE